MKKKRAVCCWQAVCFVGSEVLSAGMPRGDEFQDFVLVALKLGVTGRDIRRLERKLSLPDDQVGGETCLAESGHHDRVLRMASKM